MVIKGGYFYILLVAIALSACATDDHIDGLLLNYSAIDNPRSFETLFNHKEKFIVELPKRSWEYRLHVKKGIFRSRYVTDKGILYQGVDACIMSIHTDCCTFTYDGGFYVPFDTHDPVRIWYDISTKDARDLNGIKIFDRYTLPDTRSASRAIMGPRSTGIILSPAVSTENDRVIRILSNGY
jgi:hypothetical protein